MENEKVAKKKDRIPRQEMSQIPLDGRRRTFREVPLGYSEEQAVLEASRCIMCTKPKCVAGCPVEIDIPAFIQLIKEGRFIEAAWKIKEKNCLPAICGRVCPQEDQCEKTCVLGIKGEPVAIGRLERFVADYEREHNAVEIPEIPPPTGKKIAVVGSGPAGLTCAGDLAKLGHKVTIFENLHIPGGVLVYGIPEFRLPKSIVAAEVDYLKKLGVEILTNHVIGLTYTIEELFALGYYAVFIGIGAGLPKFLNIPGENLCGIYSANEFLTRVNLMKAFEFPKSDTPVYVGNKVAVLGAGNVAMDSARTALRLGAREVHIVYRRTRQESPARIEELIRAEEEGVIFDWLCAPTRFIGDEHGWVKAIELLRMELGEPDSSGRPRPVPIKGSEFIMEVDMVVNAIGTDANRLLFQTAKDIKLNKWGYIEVEPETCATSKRGVYAGGDIIRGSATVILAMGDARTASRAIHNFVMNPR